MSREHIHNDDHYYNDAHPRRDRTNWAWLLLLPLFFVLGWAANSAYYNNVTEDGVRYGVGGGPGYPTATATQIPNMYNPANPAVGTNSPTNSPAATESPDATEENRTSPTVRATASPSASPEDEGLNIPEDI